MAKHNDNGTVAIQKGPCVAGNASARRLGLLLEQAMPLEASATKGHLGRPPLKECSLIFKRRSPLKLMVLDYT